MTSPRSQSPQLIIVAQPPPPFGPTLMASTEDSTTQPFRWHYGEVDDKNYRVHGGRHLLVIILFSLVLFFVIICLYIKWACRYRHIVVIVSSSGHADNAPGATQSTGLDKGTIESLPVRMHVALETGEEMQCSICLSGLVEGDKVKVMPDCGHGFHPECVDQWLKSHHTCPLCRASLGVLPPPTTTVPLDVV